MHIHANFSFFQCFSLVDISSKVIKREMKTNLFKDIVAWKKSFEASWYQIVFLSIRFTLKLALIK